MSIREALRAQTSHGACWCCAGGTIQHAGSSDPSSLFGLSGKRSLQQASACRQAAALTPRALEDDHTTGGLLTQGTGLMVHVQGSCVALCLWLAVQSGAGLQTYLKRGTTALQARAADAGKLVWQVLLDQSHDPVMRICAVVLTPCIPAH